MNLPLRQRTSLALAAFYALIAGVGHALHVTDGCRDGHTVGAPACGCHACPADKPMPAASDDPDGGLRIARGESRGHDSSACAVCRALDQLKLSQSSPPFGSLFTPTLSANAAAPPSAAPSGSVPSYLARGPPTRGA